MNIVTAKSTQEIMTSNNTKNIIVVLSVIGLVSLAVSYATGWNLCVFYNITGMPCPSCGMTRAYKQLLGFDINGAFFYHPLFAAVPLIPLLFLKRRGKPIPKRIKNIIVIVLLALFLVTWIVRLILYFPTNEPMIFNHSSILGKIINIFT